MKLQDKGCESHVAFSATCSCRTWAGFIVLHRRPRAFAVNAGPARMRNHIGRTATICAGPTL